MAQNLLLNIIAKDKTKQALNGVQAGLTRLRSSVFSIQSALIGVGGGLAIRSLVNVGSQVENLSARFNFLFGNVKEGSKALDTLTDFASKVPFSLEEISSASGNLAVVSKDAEDLNKILKITGNVASVTGLDFQTTATQIQRSFAGGIASADIFRERGVRALLGFKAGATVSAEDTIKKFEEVFGEGGRFGRATEVLATTLTGTLSMLGDKLFKFRLETNKAGFFDFVKQGLVDINKLIETNEEVLQKLAVSFSDNLIKIVRGILIGGASIIDAIKPVLSFVGNAITGLFDIFSALPQGVKTFGLIGFLMLGGKGKLLALFIGSILDKIRFGIGTLAETYGNFLDKLSQGLRFVKIISEEQFKSSQKVAEEFRQTAEKLKTPMKSIKQDSEEFSDNMGDSEKAIRKFLNGLEQNANASKKELNELFKEIEKAKKGQEGLNSEFEKTATTIKDGITKPLEDLTNISKQVTNVLNLGIKGFSRGLAEALVLGKDLKTTFQEIGRTLITEILATTIEIIARKSVELVLEKAISRQKQIQSFFSGLGSFLGLGGLFGGGTSNLMGIGSAKGFFGMAKGGAVSKGQPYLVGEQGAELFIPNSTGQITQSARGTDTGTTNINFTVNAVDVKGVEELLLDNRSTIVNVINGALNDQGKEALV
jgi:predicted  nucleic acid-binding Zn-ribbon protein